MLQKPCDHMHKSHDKMAYYRVDKETCLAISSKDRGGIWFPMSGMRTDFEKNWTQQSSEMDLGQNSRSLNA